MVQKWAIGAMINVSGSIAINLGTNLMKLSHKVCDSNWPDTLGYTNEDMIQQQRTVLLAL